MMIFIPWYKVKNHQLNQSKLEIKNGKNVRGQIFKQQISDEQLSVCCCFSLKSSHVSLDQGRFTSVLFTASKDIMSNTRMFVVGATHRCT